MKNMYLYGASDDCREIDTDFGAGHESYGNIIILRRSEGNKLQSVKAEYQYDGDWGVRLINAPKEWRVNAIQGNCAMSFRGSENSGQFLHVQIPEDEDVVFCDEKTEDD